MSSFEQRQREGRRPDKAAHGKTPSQRGTPLAAALNESPRVAAQAKLAETLTRRSGAGAVIQPKWNYDEEDRLYSQDVPVEGRLWQVTFQPDMPPLYRFRMQETADFSEWKPVEEFIGEGLNPPEGALFAEQRRQEGQDRSGAAKYAFEAAPLPAETPAEVVALQEALRAGLLRIKAQRQEEKAMLDMIITEEFAKIKESGGDEELQAGLRYKRVYEHEQNLLTINRRAKAEYQELLTQIGAASPIPLNSGVEDLPGGAKESLMAEHEGATYGLGTTWWGDARFAPLEEGAAGDAGGARFVHRTTGKEYVKDRYGRFVPRFIARALRYEDVEAIAAGQPMPAKKGYGDPITGKEAADYGPPFQGGMAIGHEQKVIGQIRGYGRFLSATSSKRQPTSTSRGTYLSPFGTAEIDLAAMPPEEINEAHSEDAMEQIFGIEDLGQVEFIPKHVKGEPANVKAGRDAYRAREIVLGSPPPEAVRPRPADATVRGLIIVGLTGGATEQSVRDASGDYAGNLSFIEVNTNYQRTVDGHKGRTAFAFYAGVEDFDSLIEAVRANIGQGVQGINPAAAYVKEVRTSSNMMAGPAAGDTEG